MNSTDFECQEARNLALMFGEMVEVYLGQHSAIAAQPEWAALVETAIHALFDLAIGPKLQISAVVEPHASPPDPPQAREFLPQRRRK
jgi:hypothetical protein